MSEAVEWNDQTLYAPVLACRPVRIEDYPPERVAMLRAVEQQTGESLALYPGSVYEPCEQCRIEVALGPRGQETRDTAHGFGLAAHVLCIACAALLMAQAEGDDDVEVTVMSLGNPFKQP